MSEIIYPSSNSIYGPWLLDLDQLQQLDTVINKQWEKLKYYRESLINKEIESRIYSYPKEEQEIKRKEVERRVKDSSPFEICYKSLSIDYKSNRTLKVESFKEAAMRKEFKNDIPINFRYNIHCANIVSEIKTDSFFNNKIKYSVNTISIPEAEELFSELEGWLKRSKPRFHINIWSRIGSLFFPLLVSFIFLIPSINFSSKDYLVQEAHKILNDGISNDEIGNALEILLALQTNYELNLAEVKKKEINYSKIFLFSILIYSLIIFFPPKSIIGIGKGERKLAIWRGWIIVVTYIIPVLIILPILLNKLSNIF